MKNLRPVMLRIAAALALVASTTVNAAVSTWNGTSSVNWNLAGNWNPGIPNPGDDVIIADTTVNNSVTLNDASHTVGLIQFGTTGARSALLTINGSATTTASTTLTVTNGVSSNYGAGVGGGNLIIKCPVIVQNDQTWTLTGTVPATTSDYGLVLTVGANGTQRPLTLNGTLTKTGNGELVFIGQNVGNGNIVVNQGWLKLNAGSSTLVTVGGTGSITVNNSATFMIAKNSGTLSITKAINLNDGATFRLGGNSGTLQTIGSLITFNGNVPIIADYASLLFDFTNIWTGAINSTITGNGGTITLWNDDSGLSGTINNSGTFKMRFGSNASASAAVAWALNNAAAYYEIYGAATSVNLGSLSGSSGILRNSNTNNQPATATVGSLNTSTTFGGTIADNTSSMGVIKVGSGTLTLTGANTFSGGLNVMNGTVLLQGAAASAGFGSVTVQSGASFGGNGSASGGVTVMGGGILQWTGTAGSPLLSLGSLMVMGGGTLQSAGSAGAPPLSVVSLTLGSGSTDITTNNLNLYFGAEIANTGGLVVNGTNIINIVGAAPAVGVYDLITYSGPIGGAGFAGFQLGPLPYGVEAHLQDSGSAVQLNITAHTTEPGVWVGNVAGEWNLAGGLEWKGANSGNPQSFHQFDAVSFDNSAANFTVNVTADVTPASINVNNSTAYTFSGVGGILGYTSLAKDGPGALIVVNSNSFIGGTFISNGVVQLGDGGTNGSLAGDILNNSSLVFNRSDAAGSSRGNISGTGSVEQRGSGKFTLGGANTYTGVTTVTTGILATASGTALGDTNAGTIVADGATLDVNSQNLGAEPFTVTGAGVGGIGAIVNNGVGDNQNATRYVTLTGPTTFGGYFRWDVRDPVPANNPSGGVGAQLIGNNNDLTKVSTNVIAFINAGDIGLRDIRILGGTLTFSRSTMMGDPSRTVTVYPGATLQFHHTSEYINNVMNKVAVMTNATLANEAAGLTNQFAGPITLTGSNTFSLPSATGLNLQGPVSGDGSVTTVGTGALIISSNCTYTGGTTIGGGFLQVDGALGTGAHPLLFTAATVLSGNGTIRDPVTIPASSMLAPGDSSIGALTISSSLVLSPGCSNVFEINKDFLTNDVVKGLTSVTLGGKLILNNVGSTGYAPGDNFKLFYAGSYSGSFAAIVPATPGVGLVWVTNTLRTTGTISVDNVPTPIPLFALSASSLLSNSVNVIFTAELEPNAAQDPTNYKLSTGNPNVVMATLVSTTNVLLTLESPITNSSFTVNVKNVQDQAYVPNVVATTNVPGIALGFQEADPVRATNGSAFAYGTNTLIKVYSDGADIFNASDTFEFVFSDLTGDFDVRVMLQSLLITDPAAKAGLMARVPNSYGYPSYDDPFYMAAGFTADPTRNNNCVQYRENFGGAAVAPGAPRPGATYPTNWLRLKRKGDILTGYCGSNGLTWTPMTALDTTTNAFASVSVLHVGLAVTAHNAGLTTEALFSNYSPTPPEPGNLAVALSATNLVVSWQASLIGSTLESTGDLTPPVAWTPVAGSTLTNVYVLYPPLGATNTFFRLNSPP
jgi:fibronectin-binding autotransporter adhesin